MSFSAGVPPIRSSVVLPVTVNFVDIILYAGGDPRNARYDNGVLHVDGVSQAALEAAVEARGDQSFAVRAAKKGQAAQGLMARIAAGMPWAGKTLQIDDASQVRLTAMDSAAKGGSLPPGFFWVMADNSKLPLDAAGMTNMAVAAMNYVFALRAHYWGLRSQVDEAPTVEAVQAIDTTAGWPVPASQPAP